LYREPFLDNAYMYENVTTPLYYGLHFTCIELWSRL